MPNDETQQQEQPTQIIHRNPPGRPCRYFKLDENGMPIPVDERPYTKEYLAKLPLASLATPYEPEVDDEGQLKPNEWRFKRLDGSWMTKGEVMNLRRSDMASKGNLDAIKQIEDRELGKPKQQVESLNINATYADFLTQIAAKEQERVNTTTVTVTVDPSPDLSPDTRMDLID